MATDFSLATDIWNATLQNIVTKKPALATFAYTNYYFYNMFFKNSYKVKGGDQLEGHITLDSEGNAKLVGIWDQDTSEKIYCLLASGKRWHALESDGDFSK
jgi:uncharacterized membrane protein